MTAEAAMLSVTAAKTRESGAAAEAEAEAPALVAAAAAASFSFVFPAHRRPRRCPRESCGLFTQNGG